MRIFIIFYIMFSHVVCFAQSATPAQPLGASVVAAQPVVASVIAEPATIEESLKLIPLLLELFKNGNFLAAGALITLFLVFFLKKYALPKLGLTTAVLPIASAVLGVIAGLSVALLGGANLTQALLAVGSGPTASLLWDAAIKFFVKKQA
jgi:hypothetical protein